MALFDNLDVGKLVDQLRCELAKLLGLTTGQITAFLAFHIALQAATTAKAASGKTVTFLTTDGAKILAKNDSNGMMIVHVRANLDEGATEPLFYLAASKGEAMDANAAPQMLRDDQKDVFLLPPATKLWGRVSGGAGTGKIPVVEIQIDGWAETIRISVQRTSKG